jgi:hypothetical protein
MLAVVDAPKTSPPSSLHSPVSAFPLQNKGPFPRAASPEPLFAGPTSENLCCSQKRFLLHFVLRCTALSRQFLCRLALGEGGCRSTGNPSRSENLQLDTTKTC